ncbi:tail fiber assembly protein [Citrobacter braakii]|uniref:tail fiber assembly protein n=1 Tax=Citrobacter braakii TaxID=57706 RepID=UPI00242E4032|nr:tail fiber assembly protein [Citrobacter braakii]WFX93249.1 tail fiber assembly protein [Citrobacter braakii]WFY02292.1 tail fiber assembly protein [Citrobacter braakii]
MKYKYFEGLFYPEDGSYESIPTGAIDVSEDEYRKAMGRAPGSTFSVDDSGIVSVIPVPEPTREQYIAQAEAHKQFLLEESRQKITVWQTKLLMGRALTDAESAGLNAWMDYIDAVTAIDSSTAPDIKWPMPPGGPAS